MEGLIIKTLESNATYEISKRSRSWLKLKKDYINGIGDSLDLVPICAYFGAGKRSGWFGSIMLACYNDGIFEPVCRCGTGFSEEFLAEIYNRYNASDSSNF